MDPMLYVVAFDAMQRQLEENARFRLRRARAEVLDRPASWRQRLAAALRVRRLATPAVALDVACCPACSPA